MKSAAVFLALAATVVLAGVGDASDVGRRAKKRVKRGSIPELGPSRIADIGSGPFFVTGPDFDSGRPVVSGRDFISGLGRSSGLKYGPGLGLSSHAAPSEEHDASADDLVPSPSSVAPGTTPRYATTAGPVPVPVTRNAACPVYVPAPYPAPVDRPVPADDPYIVAAISYGPSDPGYGPSAAGYGPFAAGHGPFAAGHGPSATGYGPFITSHDGARTVAHGGRAQAADQLSPSSAYAPVRLLFGSDYKNWPSGGDARNVRLQAAR